MSNIKNLTVNSYNRTSQKIEKNGGTLYRLQDKEVTENGIVTSGIGYDALSSVNVNVEGGGSGVVLEDNKEVTITENGTTVITPSTGKDGMKKVTATVNIPSDAKEEQTKSATITENGTTTVTPDSGKTLSSVNITTNVPSDAKEEQTKSVTITENGTTTVTPDSGKTLSSVNITTNVSGGGSEEINQINVKEVTPYGGAVTVEFASSSDDSNFKYITMGSLLFRTGMSSAINKITREQIFNAYSGDTFSITDGSATLTLTITARNEGGVHFVSCAFTLKKHVEASGLAYAIIVY